MPRLVVFLDLDDTILQTTAKCPSGEPVEIAAVDRAGQALSFITPGQRQLLTTLMTQAEVIPVTGRTDEALARVLIPFNSWRITHHGAVIRQSDGGLPDWWRQQMQTVLAAAEAPLREIADWLVAGAETGRYRVSSHRVEGYLTYLSVKANAEEPTLASLRQQLQEECLPPQLALHHNGHNLAVMVRGVQKQDAVRRLIQELQQSGAIVTLGAGDSTSDIPFLKVCDFALVPRASQIQQATWDGFD
jgi:HAD superfamily hydrolase (TIGR01484 family)